MNLKTDVRLVLVYFLFLPLMIVADNCWSLEKGDKVLSVLVLDISPADNSNPLVSDTRGIWEGTSLQLGDESVVAVGLTYFLSSRFAIEAYIGLPPEPEVTAVGILDFDTVATVSIAPVSVLLQYFYPIGQSNVTIHAGIGLAYVHFFNINTADAVKQFDPTLVFDAKSTFSSVFQLGAQWEFADRFHLRLTLGKMFFDGDTTIDSQLLGPYSTTVTVDPKMTMIGFGYRY